MKKEMRLDLIQNCGFEQPLHVQYGFVYNKVRQVIFKLVWFPDCNEICDLYHQAQSEQVVASPGQNRVEEVQSIYAWGTW